MEKFDLFMQDAQQIMKLAGYEQPNDNTRYLNGYLQYIWHTYGFDGAYLTQKAFLNAMEKGHSFDQCLELLEIVWFDYDEKEREKLERWGVEHGLL